MIAVWSFWTKPLLNGYGGSWASEISHLLAWVLSVETARTHFAETSLFTDDEGARLLVDAVGLQFDHVSTALNRLRGQDPQWWMLGKLYTYRGQTRPFIHFDADVFLWQCLPDWLLSAPVFAQHPERFTFGTEDWYRPLLYESAILSAGGWLPEEWLWYTAQQGNEAACCGIFGANRLDFVAHYADRAIALIEHPVNQPAWRYFDRGQDNILFEQYLLSACLQYSHAHPYCNFHDVSIAYLFDSMAAAYDAAQAQRYGYTHLIAHAKSNPTLLARLEERVRRAYPDHYHHIVRQHKGDS